MDQQMADELALAIRMIYMHVDVFHDEMLQITPKELGMLLIVDQQGATRVKDLAQRVNLPLSTVSWTADKLVSRKLLARRTDPDDRRAILLTLTRSGRQAVKAHYSVFDMAARTALGVLSAEEGRQVTDAIRKIADSL